ncbi:MAG: GNAT family N-acetyltransferase [Flavobacteriales bacterium]
MKPIREAVHTELLKAELTPERFLRLTRKGGNEIYMVNCHNAPNVVEEIGRLREVTFRASGGGTGESIDLDEYDLGDFAYEQLIVWSVEDQEIIGGYRFKNCAEAIDVSNTIHLSTTHYFDFSNEFVTDFLPKTIELGRSWVQPNFQPMNNPKKGLFALDNIWDGLGALIKFNPEIEYFFGKVTMYPNYNVACRDFLLFFLHRFFPDKSGLMKAFYPLQIESDPAIFEELIQDLDYKEAFKVLNTFTREHGEFIPPLMNIYMNLSPTMMTFDTAINPDFGNVEETGILVKIADIYPDKKERHMDF